MAENQKAGMKECTEDIMLERKQPVVQPIYTDWVEGYNMSATAEEKKQYLDIGLSKEESPENLLRKKLYERRYLDKKGKVTGADYFIAMWMELAFVKQKRNGFFGKRAMEKTAAKVRDELMMGEGTTESLKQVLYQEYVNLISLYISLCQNDKTYKSVILGMGTIKEKTLQNKIAADIYETAIAIPRAAGMEKEYELFIRAARDSFLLAYPTEISVWNETAGR